MPLEMNWDGLYKIISGGQTGADQGGLMAAWRAGLETGGQAPAGYKVQDGYNVLLETFGLTEGGDYASRTKANIANSDGTVMISHHLTSPGSARTRKDAQALGKPLLQLNILELAQIALLSQTPENEELVLNGVARNAQRLREFVLKHQIAVLNVAGNREIKTGSHYGTNIITQLAEWIVGFAIDLLATDGKIIRKDPKI